MPSTQEQTEETDTLSRRGRKDVSQQENLFRNRLSTDEIYERVLIEADEEIGRCNRELFFSGVAAGFAITITVLIYASMTAAAGDTPLIGALLYPIGFIYIILGNYQLYTENTLPPVALILDRLAGVPAMLRMWGVVLIGNLAGGTVGALLLAYGGVLDPTAATTLTGIAMTGIETPWFDLFFKAVFAGLIVAGVVWLDFGVRSATARFLLVYIAFLTIPLGGLFHVVVASTEVMYLVFLGEIAFLNGVLNFALPVLLGNTIGGVVLVTTINYYQTSHELHEISDKLSVSDWLFTTKTALDPETLQERLESKISH
ncbi:formate/nitrite transporter family protein [Natranaeroarchaeum sulfidigenes]|uniref:Formate/nitrite family of transporter n=1 Tax=Natranaeroarchaeum sulfidigenes TaxID=2784880 RepID=A0A897MUG4_9EURY|nr:formate/nitrite transporter family protein [Natranaeroarchaeum sulfidigenes]QSG01836.1 Formate/nitrite family of transporter [Natranaeroarchaeum sulfidigenes]